MTIQFTPLCRAAGILGLVFTVGSAVAQGDAQQASKTPSHADRTFVNDAAMSSVAEIQLSQIAQKNAGSPDVKQYAERMIKDHQQANADLQKIASGKSLQVPTDMGSMHKMMAGKLNKTTGTDFDQQYMKGMLADHKKVVALFEKESKSGTDPELKAYADAKLPALREHLQMAQSMQQASGGGKSAGGTGGRGAGSSAMRLDGATPAATGRSQ